MAELGDEARSVRHHKMRIAFLFSAMRHFARELRRLRWTVEYMSLDAPDNRGSLTERLARPSPATGPSMWASPSRGSGRGCGGP